GKTRAERLEEARRARRRKAQLTRLGLGAVAVVLVGILAVLVISGRRAEQAERRRLTAGACRFDTRNDTLSAPPNNHVPPAGYKVDPPSGGNHAPSAAPAAVYGGERPPPPDSQLVHSLEHGYIVLWHRPDLSEEDMAEIRGVYDGFSRDVLVVPRASLRDEVAATAWGKRLLCPEVESARLAEFVRLYRNEGPEKIEHP
ncbi:MAG: DUF3105 domain-containing protein, partial [Actinomycetota bacterium]|nr:DUF3105 domain-containing protein [Actinomycetota bacterium]